MGKSIFFPATVRTDAHLSENKRVAGCTMMASSQLIKKALVF